MEINSLLATISTKPVKVKEIIQAIEKLKTNNSDLATFLNNNPNIGVSEFEVASELLVQTTKFIENRISMNITKNIYDQHSIIYIILMLASTKSKSDRNKLTKIYYDVITNTSKFDIFVKVVKNARKLSGDSTILELFWLIPLFSNLKVLMTIDYGKFIGEMKTINGANDEFSLGYSFYVTSDVLNLDKPAYKQFLVDGLKN
jgi:hypothetical protein